jgi:hypothetical protein
LDCWKINLLDSWEKHFPHNMDLHTPLLVGSLPSGIPDDAKLSAGFGQDPLHDGLDAHVDRNMLNIIPQILPNIGQSTCLALCCGNLSARTQHVNRHPRKNYGESMSSVRQALQNLRIQDATNNAKHKSPSQTTIPQTT